MKHARLGAPVGNRIDIDIEGVHLVDRLIVSGGGK